MPTQQELEDRYNFDALAAADDRTWQLAKQHARTNPTIATAIRDIERAYAWLADENERQADEPADTTARRDATSSEVAAQLKRRGFTPDDAA